MKEKSREQIFNIYYVFGDGPKNTFELEKLFYTLHITKYRFRKRLKYYRQTSLLTLFTWHTVNHEVISSKITIFESHLKSREF